MHFWEQIIVLSYLPASLVLSIVDPIMWAALLSFALAQNNFVGATPLQGGFTSAAPELLACPQRPTLTPQFWNRTNLDGYLRNYPSGNSLDLDDYVAQVAPGFPFKCGLGVECHVTSLCKPLQGPDWYILYATSQWNDYVNSLFTALKSSSQLCQEIIPQVLKDFGTTEAEQIRGPLNEVDIIRAILSPIDAGGTSSNLAEESGISDWSAAVAPIISEGPQTLAAPPSNVAPPNRVKPSFQFTNQGTTKSQPSVWQPEEGNHTPDAPTSRKVKRQLLGPNTPVVLYNSNMPLSENIQATSYQFQNIFRQSVEHKLSSPISLDVGIFESLKRGRFLVDSIQPAGLLTQAKEVVVLITISAMLRSENAFVLVRKSSCHRHREKLQYFKDELSFCASDGTFIQIVKTHNNNIVKKFYKAHLIRDKYGFSTSFLASQAWKCSEVKSGQPETGKLDPEQLEACSFDLPVCVLTEDYQQEMLMKGYSVVQMCHEQLTQSQLVKGGETSQNLSS